MKSARQPFAGLTQSMAAKNIRNFISNEDDEDEEALRLAALESLRVKGLPPPPLVQPAQPSVVPPNQVFQRHMANQNLISIIPVEHHQPGVSPPNSLMPPRGTNALLATPPDFHEKVAVSRGSSSSSHSFRNVVSRPPPLHRPVQQASDSPAEEKPRVPTKFSRFNDSDSDESEDFDISLRKSESEAEEEIIIEEDEENGDLVIEVEDYIVLEEADEINGAQEEETPKVEPRKVTPSAQEEALQPTSKAPTVFSASKVAEIPAAPRTPSTCKDGERTSKPRSPPVVSSATRRKSPEPKTKSRCNEASSSNGNARGKEAKNSGDRQRSRSPPPNDRRPPPRRSPGERRPQRRSSSPSDRRLPPRRSSPSNDRKQLPRRSPPSDVRTTKPAVAMLTDSERLESRKRKFETPPDAESGTVKREGKIRLTTAVKTTDSPVLPTSKRDDLRSLDTLPEKKRVAEDNRIRTDDKKKSVDAERDEPKSRRKDSSDDDRGTDKKTKKNKKKPKEKKRKRSRSRSGDQKADGMTDKRPKSIEPSAEVDLRAELQRRRVHRYDEGDHSRSRSPDRSTESRRILVLKSPSPSSERPSGLLSKHRRSSPDRPAVNEEKSRSGSSSSSDIGVAKRGGGVQVKRNALLASPIDVDKGRETTEDPLEDRIRQIRARNEQIRKRQLEIEADKLQYA